MRTKTINLIEKHDIPQITIAVCADVDKSLVSLFRSGARIPTAKETAIINAVDDIVRVIERLKPIVPNIGDGVYMRDLIRKWHDEGVFVVLVSDSPTRYFDCRKDNSVTSTPYLLQARALTRELADQVAGKLREQGNPAVVLENPYGSIDMRYEKLCEVGF